MLVLAFPVRPDTDVPRTESGDIAAFMDGVRGAIDALVADGLVDRDRVGIMGWSMTGERVLNQVTFSDAPIRAATILDGDANTLFSLTVTYGVSDGIQARKATTNDGLPFGETLEAWVRNDPALHTDCVRAALRIESYGPWVRNNWDVYGLLRRQFKPAEMVILPGGTHGLMTPSERMISLQGNVDWFRFWLKGEERSEPFLWAESDLTLKDQYRRWHEMAALKHADDARPACARKGG
jgi:dipeptidyl aminopeptidase/acylaminoacyl peptidase